MSGCLNDNTCAVLVCVLITHMTKCLKERVYFNKYTYSYSFTMKNCKQKQIIKTSK